MKVLAWVLITACCAMTAGCSGLLLLNGGIYSHTVEPLTFNKYPTEMAGDLRASAGDIQHIQFRASLLWGTNGIGDIARKNGMTSVHYADLESRKVLFGLWQEDIVHVYGR